MSPSPATGPEKGTGLLAAHTLTVAAVAQTLGTDQERGLSNTEAQRRLAADGSNIFKGEKPITIWQVVVRQFASFLIAILILAGIVSLIAGEIGDAIVIWAIVVLNAALGAFQELRAEGALEALRQAVTPTAQVIRESILREMPAADLVRGDLVVLRAGDLAPADLRLTEDHSLSVDESPLTGESVAVQKSANALLEERAALGDRVNCVYMGTSITYGRGAGIVYATGMNTQLGQIARLVSSQRRMETPLQHRLGILGKQLGVVALGLCLIIFITGWLRGEDLLETFLVAVSLAVAAIPEGLPAVVTIALALGLQRMLRRHALIRRLAAVETLGAATVICTDKTGTLTRGEMAVEQLHLAGEDYCLENTTLRRDGKAVEVVENSPLHAMLLGMALCNDATLEKASNGTLQVTGSPTEVALARAAQQLLGETAWKDKYPRITEVPFDSQRKRMSTAHQTPEGQSMVLVKGAPDVVLPLCSRIMGREEAVLLGDAAREDLSLIIEGLASRAYRLLAVAYKEDTDVSPDASAEELERDLTFLGLVGMIDPPRPETPGAVTKCTEAGIHTIMVTGDHAQTAAAIAQSVGILPAPAIPVHALPILTGPQVDEMNLEELGQALENTRVFARVAPYHKLNIVEALQRRGEVVAMTGDGSNDAPALKKANIGVAMGIRGTAVSKEAADMVLTDDNFQSIVSAVHEGRIIYSNIRKVVMYLLSCNLGEVLAVFVAMVSGLPLLLQPIQILWVNLVTDSLPALALSAEKEEPGIMRLPPRDPKEGILTSRTTILMVSQGVMVGVVTLAAFLITLQLSYDVTRAQTAAFVTLTLSELLRAFSFRTELVSVWRQGVFSNRWMIGAMPVSAALLFAVVYLPQIQPWFNTTTPGPTEWTYIGPLVLLPFLMAEAAKVLMKRQGR